LHFIIFGVHCYFAQLQKNSIFFSGKRIFSQSLTNITLNPSDAQARGAKLDAAVTASVDASKLALIIQWFVDGVSLARGL